MKDGKPDISRFCREMGYDKANVYPWVNDGRLPEKENLERLSADFGVPVPWLLFGESAAHEMPPLSVTTSQKEEARDLMLTQLVQDCIQEIARLEQLEAINELPVILAIIQAVVMY